METFQLNDLVRVNHEGSKYHGLEGRVAQNDRSDSVPFVVNLPGAPVGVCFTSESLELVEAAAPLPALQVVTLEFYEVYKADGTFRWATTNRNELGNRSSSDYVLTRTWSAGDSAEVYSRPIG